MSNLSQFFGGSSGSGGTIRKGYLWASGEGAKNIVPVGVKADLRLVDVVGLNNSRLSIDSEKFHLIGDAVFRNTIYKTYQGALASARAGNGVTFPAWQNIGIDLNLGTLDGLAANSDTILSTDDWDHATINASNDNAVRVHSFVTSPITWQQTHNGFHQQAALVPTEAGILCYTANHNGSQARSISRSFMNDFVINYVDIDNGSNSTSSYISGSPGQHTISGHAVSNSSSNTFAGMTYDRTLGVPGYIYWCNDVGFEGAMYYQFTDRGNLRNRVKRWEILKATPYGNLQNPTQNAVGNRWDYDDLGNVYTITETGNLLRINGQTGSIDGVLDLTTVVTGGSGTAWQLRYFPRTGDILVRRNSSGLGVANDSVLLRGFSLIPRKIYVNGLRREWFHGALHPDNMGIYSTVITYLPTISPTSTGAYVYRRNVNILADAFNYYDNNTFVFEYTPLAT